MSSVKKVIVITGANTGLGLETVRALLRRGPAYDIVIGSRSVQKGEDAVASLKKEFSNTQSTLTTVQIDVESDDSIQKARDTVASKFGKVDALINNAGANLEKQAQDEGWDYRKTFNKIFDLNVVGAAVTSREFVPLLLKSSDPRLIFIASGTSSLADTERFDTKAFQILNASPEAGWPKPALLNPCSMYKSVKCGLNMQVRDWAQILHNDGVKVWGVSPGFLATNLNGIGAEQLKKIGALDPSVGAEFITDVVEGKRDADAGKIIKKDGVQDY